MPSEYPKASWCSYIVDLDKTTGVRHVMCCELTTCEDASLAIASTLGSSSRNSGSSQSFSCAISGQPSSSQPSQKLPGKDNASSLQDVDPSVLSFDLSAKQTTANMQSLDPSILSCKPSKAKIIDQSQVSASGSFSILDYIVSNGNTSSSGDVRPFEGISHKEKKAAPSSISILGDIFSNGQFVTSAKSENSIKSSGYLYSGGQLVPFAQNENVITRNGFQQKARALTVDIAPPEPNKLALSTSQTLGFSPDSAQAGKSTRATSAALSPKVIRDLPKVHTVVGKPTKTFSALDLTEREAVVDNNQDIVSPFLDVETSFRQQEEWYDVHNSEESEDSAPKLYTPLAPLISTSGLVSPDQMVVRMTVLENLAAAKVLAGQVESLPSFEVNTEDLSRSCDALNLLSYDMSAYSDGSQEHLDFAFASQSKQRLKLTSIFEPSPTISEATGVEIALDESGELFLVPVYPDVTEAVTSTSVTEGDPSQNAEQSSILNPGIDLKNVNLDVVFGQGATDLDDESDFSESVDLPHSVNVDSVAQASASAFSRLFKLPSAVKLDPLGLTVARLSQNIKVGDANLRLQPECSQDLFEPETDAVESAHPRAEAGEDAGTIVEFDDARDAETFPNVVPTGLVLSETRAESLNSENAKKDIPEVTTDASETVAPEQNSADSSDPVGGFVADSEKTIAQAKARRQAAAAKRISDDDFVDAISDEADPGISEDEDDAKAELSEHGTSPAALQNGRYTSPTKMMDSRFEDPHTPPQSPLKEEDRACWGSDGNGGFCTPTSPNPEEATSTADDNESLCKDALKSFALDVSPEAKNKLARILAGTSSSPAIGTSSDQVSVMAPSVQLTTNDEDPGLAGKCTKNAARLAGIIANVTATTMLNQQETSLCGNSFADDDVFDPEGILAKGVFENNSQSHASETRSTGTSKARFENVSEDEERQQSLHNLNRALAIVDEGGSETGSTPMKAKKPFAMAGRRRTSQISRSFNQYRSRRTSSEQSRMSDADWLEWLLEKAAQEQKKKEGISMGWDYELQEYTHVPGPAKIAQSGPAPATGEHTEVNYNSARATNTTAAEARDDCLEYSLNTSATHSRRSSGNFMSGTSAPSTPEEGVLLHENIIAEEGKAELVAPFEVKSAEEEKEAVVEDDTAKPISSEEAGEATDLPESPQRANTRNSRISISAGDIVEAEMSVKMLAGLPFAVGDILEAEDYIEYGEISEIPDDRPNFPRAFYGDVSIAVGHAAFGLGNWIVRKCLGRD